MLSTPIADVLTDDAALAVWARTHLNSDIYLARKIGRERLAGPGCLTCARLEELFELRDSRDHRSRHRWGGAAAGLAIVLS
jgi:hypothetical protein